MKTIFDICVTNALRAITLFSSSKLIMLIDLKEIEDRK